MSKLTLRDGVRVHEFGSTADAYNHSQTGYYVWASDDDFVGELVEVYHADVLVVPSEKVVGFMYRAWPVAVTENKGGLHNMEESALAVQRTEYPDTFRIMDALISEICN